jgi:hypothetical protein
MLVASGLMGPNASPSGAAFIPIMSFRLCQRLSVLPKGIPNIR